MHDQNPPDLSHLSNDEHIKRVSILIRKAQALAGAVYRMGPTTADNATPREIMSEIMDELVRVRRGFEQVPSVFTHDGTPMNPFARTAAELIEGHALPPNPEESSTLLESLLPTSPTETTKPKNRRK